MGQWGRWRKPAVDGEWRNTGSYLPPPRNCVHMYLRESRLAACSPRWRRVVCTPSRVCLPSRARDQSPCTESATNEALFVSAHARTRARCPSPPRITRRPRTGQTWPRAVVLPLFSPAYLPHQASPRKMPAATRPSRAEHWLLLHEAAYRPILDTISRRLTNEHYVCTTTGNRLPPTWAASDERVSGGGRCHSANATSPAASQPAGSPNV